MVTEVHNCFGLPDCHRAVGVDGFIWFQSVGFKGKLDRVHPHDACILSGVSASISNVLCLLNRSNFSSGVLSEACSEFSPSLGERAAAQRLGLGLNRQFLQEMRPLHFITTVMDLVQRSVRWEERLQLNSIVLEQANECNFYFSPPASHFIFSKTLDIHFSVYSHTFPISYFFVCIW